ncbi:MAG: TetR/AcrR family transcriptional regulator [Limisphaerales bacterium]
MSVTTARKQREREAREVLIVDHAQRLLLKNGFQELNLDELAGAVEYSKGTLYQHFASKEEITLAVATRALRERADLFERALTFTGRSRERARAIGFACCHFMIAHPDYFHVEMMLKCNSFWNKASTQRQQEHGLEAGRVFRAVHRVVLEGETSGDLPRGRMPSEHIALAMAAVTVGSHIMAQEPDLRLLAGVKDPVRIVRENQDVLLDGLGWRPLYREHDYAAVDRRIRADVFPGAAWLAA